MRERLTVCWERDREQAAQLRRIVAAANRDRDPPDPGDAPVFFVAVGAQAAGHGGDQVDGQLGVRPDNRLALGGRLRGIEDLSSEVARSQGVGLRVVQDRRGRGSARRREAGRARTPTPSVRGVRMIARTSASARWTGPAGRISSRWTPAVSVSSPTKSDR